MENIQEHRWVKILAIISGLALFVMFSILVLTKPISQDEGVFLTIGKYLNQGWLPYQDLFDHKPPGIYFLFATLFKLFGVNVWVVKITLILSTLGSAVLVKRIGDILKSGAGIYAATIFMFLMTQFEGYYAIAEPFLLLPLLLSLWILLRFKDSRRLMLLAGVFLGTAILFKQTAVLSAIPLIILASRLTKPGKIYFFSGLILLLLALAVYLSANGLMTAAWNQVVTLTLTSYPREPFPYVLEQLRHSFIWTAPIWIMLVLAVRKRLAHKQIIWALILLPVPLMFIRHYPHYWVQILPFVSMIVAVALIDWEKRWLTAATLVFCLSVAGGKIALDMAPNFTKLKEQLRIAEVLREQPTDMVLAENQFTAFYFLLPQRPLNRYLYITEITNADGAEQKTLEDIQSGKRVMILWPEDPDYAYAKTLQKFVLEESVEIQKVHTLGMRVGIY